MLSDAAIINVGSAALAAISTSFIAYVAFLTKRMERRSDLDAMDRRARAEQEAAERKLAVIAVEGVKVKLAETSSAAVAAVRDVKAKLAETSSASEARLDDIAQVGRATHRLVNNAMTIQLRLNASLSRRLAELTGDPADIKVAEEAQKLLEEHEKSLLQVDHADNPKSDG